eukprot:scaffold43563_cov69-Phaeocystis_antarctica.AAC.3
MARRSESALLSDSRSTATHRSGPRSRCTSTTVTRGTRSRFSRAWANRSCQEARSAFCAALGSARSVSKVLTAFGATGGSAGVRTRSLASPKPTSGKVRSRTRNTQPFVHTSGYATTVAEVLPSVSHCAGAGSSPLRAGKEPARATWTDQRVPSSQPRDQFRSTDAEEVAVTRGAVSGLLPSAKRTPVLSPAIQCSLQRLRRRKRYKRPNPTSSPSTSKVVALTVSTTA